MYTNADRCARQKERDQMVEQQIIVRGVSDVRVLAAMRKTPRHLFFPADRQADAYADRPAPIGCGQTISQPYMVAAMTEALALMPASRVLEIGAGSGYQTAVIADIAAQVVSVERQPDLAETARRRLDALGYNNVTVVVGDGTLGYEEAAPYDGILVTAAAPEVPRALQRQLAPGGRLVAPVGARDVQHLVTITREEDGAFSRREGIACRFVPLIGEQGWPEGT